MTQPVSKDIATSMAFQQYNNGLSVAGAGGLIKTVSISANTAIDVAPYINSVILIITNTSSASVNATSTGAVLNIRDDANVATADTGVATSAIAAGTTAIFIKMKNTTTAQAAGVPPLWSRVI